MVMDNIQRLSYDSPTIIKDFTTSLQSTGFVVLSGAPIDHQLVEVVYEQWGAFFRSEERFLYPYDTNQADGYVSTSLSETAKGYHTKDIKSILSLVKAGAMS